MNGKNGLLEHREKAIYEKVYIEKGMYYLASTLVNQEAPGLESQVAQQKKFTVQTTSSIL